MLNIKYNMKSSQTDLYCDLCKLEGRQVEETQKHIFHCPVLSRKCEESKFKYEDLFANNTYKIADVARIFMRKIEIREEILKNI